MNLISLCDMHTLKSKWIVKLYFSILIIVTKKACPKIFVANLWNPFTCLINITQRFFLMSFLCTQLCYYSYAGPVCVAKGLLTYRQPITSNIILLHVGKFWKFLSDTRNQRKKGLALISDMSTEYQSIITFKILKDVLQAYWQLPYCQYLALNFNDILYEYVSSM